MPPQKTHINLPRPLSLSCGLNSRLFLICGSIGSGKTTLSLAIAERASAMRLTLDEWVNALYGAHADSIADFDPQARVKVVMWRVAEQALRLGANVVLDWGFWKRNERDEYRAKASGIMGCTCTVVFTDCPKEQCCARIRHRNEHMTALSVAIPLDKIGHWWDMFEPPLNEEHIRVPT